MSSASRLSAAVLALSALAACATTGENAQTNPQAGNQRAENSAAPERGERNQREANNAQRPARVDRQARARIGREDTLTQMTFWAAEYETFPNDLEAAQKFRRSLAQGRAFRSRRPSRR